MVRRCGRTPTSRSTLARRRFDASRWRVYAAILAAVACHGDAPTAPPLTPPTPDALARIDCVVNVTGLVVACPTVSGASLSRGVAPPESRSDAASSEPSGTVAFTPSNARIDGNVFSFDATITNLIGQALGTTDGVRGDPDGVRVLFAATPFVTGGSGVVDFDDPAGGGSLVDGFAVFVEGAPKQPYYRYDGPLAPGEKSPAKRWRLHVPSSVTWMRFTLYVNAATAHPQGWVDVTPATAKLRAGQTVSLSAVVRERVGTRVSDASVVWASDATSVATVDAATGVVTAMGDGVATISATSTSGGVTRAGNASLTVLTPSGATTTIGASPATLTVRASSTITVQVKNPSGTNVTAGGDTVGLSVDAGTLSAVTDRGDGTYVATVTSTVARDVHVSGTINGAAIAHPATVTFTAGAPASIRVHAGDGQSAVAGSAVSVAPAVRVSDADGNAVRGATIVFAAAANSGSIAAATQTTDSSGVATVTRWTLGTVAGTNNDTLIASVGALKVTFIASAVAGAAAKLTISAGDGQSAAAGSTLPTSPAVLVADANGNSIAGASVIFTVKSGGGNVVGDTAITDVRGIATVGGWKLGTTVGLNELDARVHGGTLVTTFSATAAPGPLHHFRVESSGGGALPSQIAGTPFGIAISARDTFENVVTGFIGTVNVAASVTGTAGIGATAAFTAGVLPNHSVTLAQPSAGAVITVTRASGGSQSGSSAPFPVTAGAVHHFVVEAGGGGLLGAQSAGTPFTVRVTAQDANNNVVTGFAGTVDITSTRVASAGLGTTGVFSAGVLTRSITLTQSGSATVTATLTGGTASGATAAFDVTSAILHHFLVEAAGSGAVDTQTVGIPFGIRISARDAFDNTVTSFGGSVDVASNRAGSVGLTTSAAFTAGVLASHSVTLTRPGAASTITVTRSGGSETGTSGPFVVKPGAVDHFVVERLGGGDIGPQTAGAPFNVRITAMDVDSNVATGFIGTVNVTSNRIGSAGLGSSATFSAGVLASHGVTLTQAGLSSTLTATNSAGAQSGVSNTFTVSTGASAGVATSAGNTQSATVGSAVAVRPAVVVTDANGNPVVGASVTFAVSAGGGSITDSVQTTNASGVATLGGWTLGTVAGTNNNSLTASIGTASATFTATATPSALHHFAVAAQGGSALGDQTAASPFNVRITAQDAFGNTVTGFTGTVDVTSNRAGSAGLSTSAAFTNGVLASHTITLTQAGVGSTLTATRTSGGSQSGTSGAFIVNAAAAASMAAHAGDAQNAVAGTPVAIAPAVKIVDAYGNSVAGVAVTFAVSAGGGSVTGATPNTDASGIATVGSWTVGVTAGASNTLSATAGALSTSFSAIATAGGVTSLTKQAGDGQTAVAGSAVGTAPAVLATDTHGNPVAGAGVTFTVVTGNGSVIGATQITNASGVATVGSWTLGTSTATSNTLTATAGAASTTFSATAVAGAATSITRSAGNAQSVTVGTAVGVGPAVVVADANGNPVAGVSVTFSVTSGGGSITGATQTTDASGSATLGSWTVGATAGPNALTATAGPLSTTFSATGVAGAPALMTKSAGDAQSATVATAVATAPSVHITDIHGNPAAGVSVSFVVATGGGSVTGASQTTDAAGMATVGSWTLGTTAGTSNNTLTASAAGLSVTYSASATSAPASIMGKRPGDGQSAQVNSTVAAAPSVLVTDAHNNPVAGVAVTFAVTAGGGSITGSTQTTDASGVATLASWTLGTVSGTSNNSVTATAGSLSAVFTATATAGALHHFAVEAQGGGTLSTETAGTPFGVRITAQDQYGNTATSFAGTVDVTSNRAGSAGLTTSAAFTAGVLASHSVTLTQPGASSTITATRTGGSESGTSASFTVNTGALHHFLVELAGGGAVGTQTAGSPFSVRITAQDQLDNTVTSFTGTVDVTSNRTGTSGLTTSAAFTAGVLASHTITLTQPGASSTITATATGGTTTGTSNSFTVNTGALHHFLVEAAGGGALASQTAGIAFNVRITAQDAVNNTVTSFTGTADVTSNRVGSTGLTTTAAFSAGVLASHAVTLTQSGTSSTISATRTGSAESGTSAGFTVVAAALHHFLVEAAGGGAIGSQIAGTAFAIRVTAQDQFNNTELTFGGTVDVSSNRTGSSGLTTSAVFTSGVLTSHAITLTQSGAASTVTVTRTGGSETGTSASFTVAPAAVHHFLVEAQGGGPVGTQTAGSAFSVRVTAQDVNDNTVTGFTGTVYVSSNRAGSSGLTTSASFVAGVLASHAITLTQSGASSTITATRTGGTEAGTSAAFAVDAGTLHHFLVESAGGGALATQTASAPFAVRIIAQDASDNTVPSFTGSVDVTSNRTGSSGLTTSAAFTAGVLASHSITLTQAGGSSTITATRTGGTEAGTSAAFAVNPGALDHFLVEAAGGGAITSQTAGTPFSVRVTALDAANNTVTSFTGTVDVTSNRTGSAGLTTTAAFTAGVLASHAVTLTQTGAGATITATRTGGSEAGTSGTFTVIAAAIDHFLVEAAGGGALGQQEAGVPFSVRITAQDLNDNTFTGFNGTAVISSNRTGSAGLTTTASFVNGVLASHSVTLTGIGASSTITATKSGSTESGTSAGFTVVAGAVHHYLVEKAGGGAIGTQLQDNPLDVQITAQDVANNTATSFTGTVDVSAGGGGTLSAGSGTTPAFTAGTLATRSVTFSNSGSFTVVATTTGSTETGNAAVTVLAPLAITSTTPTASAVNVDPRNNLTVIYNRSVTPSAGAFTIECPSGGTSYTSTTSGSGTPTITITPTTSLKAPSACRLTVNAANVADAFGFHAPSNTTVDFSTRLFAHADSYPETVIGNVSINSANASPAFSVTANDTLDAAATITAYGPNSSSNTHLSANGGTIVMTTSGANMGQFTYEPPTGFSGSDTFSYTLSSNGSTSSATVTITVSAPVWFIDNTSSCVSSCDGRLSHPFTTLASFQGVNDGVGTHPAANQTVFLYESATSYTGPITLLTGQKLVGQDATSSLATISGATPAASSSAFPVMNSANGTVVSIVGASGGVALANGASATVRGLTIATTGGTALASGTSFGTLTFSSGTADVTINATGGGALSLTSGAVSGSLASVSSSGGTSGLNLTSLTGTLTINGGALSGASGATVNVSGGSAALSYAGTVAQTNGARIASIASMTGGSVTLSGALTCNTSCTGILAQNNSGGTTTFSNATKTINTSANSGAGVTLTSNTGATITFSGGGLAITTNIGNGFDATGGGTVIVSGASNTIATGQGAGSTGSGIALRVQNTTIGTGGLNFASTSTGNGATTLPANGIILDNTGSTAGLTVAGTGGTCAHGSTAGCSGGHITSTTGSDGTSGGTGIYLNRTVSPSFTRMLIDGTQPNFGLSATATTNLTLNNVVMDGSSYGTNTANNEGTVYLRNMAGTTTVTSGYYANGKTNNVRIQNDSSGSITTTANFSGTTFGLTQSTADAGLYVQSDAGTTNVTVNGSSSFLGAQTNNVDIRANNGTLTVNLSNNSFANGQSGGSSGFTHVNLDAGRNGAEASGNVTYTISNNTMNNAKGPAIQVYKDRGTQAISGTITGNTIGNGTAGTGSLFDAVLIKHAASGSHRVLIDQNTIQNYNIFGIHALFLDPSAGSTSTEDGSLHMTITRNTIQSPNSSLTTISEAIRLMPSNGAGSHTMCVNLGHGTGRANSIASSTQNGGASWDVGSASSGGTPYFKMAGLTDFSDSGILTLGNADNGVSDGFSDMQYVTILSSTSSTGATCNLP